MVKSIASGNIKTYGNKKTSGHSKSAKVNKIVVKQYVTTINNYFINPNPNSQGTSGSGDEFDKLFKGYQPPNQSQCFSFSNKKFHKRQDSFLSYNSDVTPLSSSSSVHLFKDTLKDSNHYYSPLALPKVGKKKNLKTGNSIVKKRKVLRKKKVQKLECKLPMILSPRQTSSTPNNPCMVTPKNRWIESHLSPIRIQPPSCLSSFTPKSTFHFTSPKDMFAIEENYENRSNQKANESSCDISALVAGLNNLGLSTKKNTNFLNINCRRSRMRSQGRCSNLDVPYIQERSKFSFEMEENNRAVFKDVNRCRMTQISDENKENFDVERFKTEASKCTENVEINADVKEIYNQGTVIEHSISKSHLEIPQIPGICRFSDVKTSQQETTTANKDFSNVDTSFPKDSITRCSLVLPRCKKWRKSLIKLKQTGKKWRKSLIKLKQAEARRATVWSTVLETKLKDAGQNVTSCTSPQSCNDTQISVSFNESILQRVCTRIKKKQPKKTTIFHQITEEDSFETIHKTSACILDPVVEDSKAVLLARAVEERIKSQDTSLSEENVSDDDSEKMRKTPIQTKETELSIREQLKESPVIHSRLCTSKIIIQEEECQTLPSTTPNRVQDSSFETPPCIKLGAQGFSTITKRRLRNITWTTANSKDNADINEEISSMYLSSSEKKETSPDKNSSSHQYSDEDIIVEDLPSSLCRLGEEQHEEVEVYKQDSISALYEDAESGDEQDSWMLETFGIHCEKLPFSEAFSDEDLSSCEKVGEGVYGEVFMLNKKHIKTVLKIIPIEGDLKVNGESQKKFHEVSSEVIITEQLSNLRNNKQSSTEGFCQLVNKLVVKGKYPPKLLELWNKYHQNKGSDNDCPDMFQENQLYLVLELEYAGKPVETFKFSTAQQCYSVLLQTIFSLAVAEEALEFEHRDMHFGNILVKSTNKKYTSYVISGKPCKLPTYGVQATIIDFTLSRITINGQVMYFDLASDPDIFLAESTDYQFEIYRIMKNDVNNVWKVHAPVTNVRWLHYLVDKFLNEINNKIKNKKLKKHTEHVKKLKNLNKLLEDETLYSSFELADYLLYSFSETSSIIVCSTDY